MPEQPNKPRGDFDESGEPRKVEDKQAVKNQGSVTPEDYDRDNVGSSQNST